MVHAIAGSQRRCGAFGIFCAVAALMGLAGSVHAEDARANARNEIRLYKADIRKANAEISSRKSRIFAGELLIIAAEAAVDEAKKKKDNEAAVIVLQLSLAALKTKKDDLVKEKQEWQIYKEECQQALAEWEAYLRKLGG